MTIFEAQQNTDTTEGRGRMKGFAWFDNLEEAVDAVQGKGVMGMGPGDVAALTIHTDLEEIRKAGTIVESETVYSTGWTFGRSNGKPAYAPGWDPRDDDPDYRRYLELRARFE